MTDMTDQVRFIVGADGGGTKTSLVLYAVAADGTLCRAADARGGSMNYNHIGVEQSVANVVGGLRAVCAAAGIEPEQVSAVGIGDPSCDIETTGPAGDAFRSSLCAALRVPVLLKSDAYVTLYALTRGECPGVLTISGTGAICIGEDSAHRLTVAGGWGQLTGDEGSGYYIGLSGLKAAARASDGIAPSTSLLPAALERFGVTDARDMIGVLYDPARTFSPAAFAETVDACARAGDAVALGILDRTAAYLACYTASVVRRTGATFVGVYGSVLTRNIIVRTAFEEKLKKVCPGVTVCEPSLSPEEAAARLALSELL